MVSIIEFLKVFKDDKACEQYLLKKRFGSQVSCVYCRNEKAYQIKTTSKCQRFKCGKCKKRFSAITNTIFEGTKIGLQTWFLAYYLLSNSSKGISSIQLAKQLKITQKTAWFMLHRLRQVAAEKFVVLSGDIEVDETYVGGKEKNKHSHKRVKGTQGRSTLTKEPVIGIIKREDEVGSKQVIAEQVKDTKLKTIEKTVFPKVAEGSNIVTDEFRNYRSLKKRYAHFTANHSKGEYVRERVIHTNNIENFWSIFKRGYVGVYHYMSRKHLQRYLNEYCFRFNKRNKSFDNFFRNIEAPLSYKQLTHG